MATRNWAKNTHEIPCPVCGGRGELYLNPAGPPPLYTYKAEDFKPCFFCQGKTRILIVPDDAIVTTEDRLRKLRQMGREAAEKAKQQTDDKH